jgi:hypothetical protein
MIKIFIPAIKGKQKTSVRGFWYSQETKKTYYDYLEIRDYFSYPSYRLLESLRTFYNQEAIAIKNDNEILKIHYKDKTEVLSNRIYAEVKSQDLRAEIKKALRVYGGVTIYKIDNKYFKEIFYK